ncbi:MAG: vanadium-dependent haloperoxidase [Planctomycetes bacterium]|nr:vanadium-dependent haloperoxidase [Planctomycetota bacterium]
MKTSLPRLSWALALAASGAILQPVAAQHSAAREWNELLLDSIRHDLARPTVHARNLYHLSCAMWDAWATYDATAKTILFQEDHSGLGGNIDAMREESLSYASYEILKARFVNSPAFVTMAPQYDAKMIALGYSTTNPTTVGNSPAAIGNRIAQAVLAFGSMDNSNEANNYANLHYSPVNAPLIVALPGNPTLTDPNRWQPLALSFFIDQSGNPIPGGYPPFLSPEWGQVTPYSLSQKDLTVHERGGYDYWVFHDPGLPPEFGTPTEQYYKWGFEMVAAWSSHLDPTDGVMIDASPASVGNAMPLPADFTTFDQFYDFTNGGDIGTGHAINPATGMPYAPQMVPRGDYCRILAEFWADGPDSETPPGHWFTLLNYVSDHPQTVKKIGGTGPTVNDLEWDVKCYLALGGAMHDCAVASWGVKGWYDFLRPVSAIRYLADLGQSTDMLAANYNPNGITLHPGLIENVTFLTTAAGQRHAHLAGSEGKIALKAWRGPTAIVNPDTDEAGVGWILAENWWPYQRPSFVTPPFAGYVSGHSTYSRAGAVTMHMLTGDEFFPGGMGVFPCQQDQFLVFEDGPSVNVTLQWGTYYDASDQCSLSRIWGGIHPPCDDIPGRKIGQAIGEEAWLLSQKYYDGTAPEMATYETYGAGCAGSAGVVSLAAQPSGMPVPGSTMVVDVTNLPMAAANTVMFLGLTRPPSPLDLTPIGMGGCTLDTNIFATPVVPAAGGTAQWSLNIPDNPFWLGKSLYHQAFTLDLGVNTLGVTSSVAGRGLIGR